MKKFFTCLSLISISCLCFQPSLSGNTAEFKPSGEWMLLGPFPNVALAVPNEYGARRGGLDTDFLSQVGGESEAVLSIETASRVRWDDLTEPLQLHTTREERHGRILLGNYFEATENRVAYAYTTIHADQAGEAVLLFGSDDGARIWVNGHPVHRVMPPQGRPLERAEDEVRVSFQSGTNRILIKVENARGGWGFHFEPLTLSEFQRFVTIRLSRELPLQKIEPQDGGGFYLKDESLPQLNWRYPGLAGKVLESTDLNVRWFGPDLIPVTSARESGLYTALVTYRCRQGIDVRRSLPFVKGAGSRVFFDPVWQRVLLDQTPNLPFPAEIWNQLEPMIHSWSSQLLEQGWSTDPFPALLAGYSDVLENEAGFHFIDRNPVMSWMEGQLTLKRVLLGIDEDHIAAPRRRTSPAPVLRSGTTLEAGLPPGALAHLRQLANAWAAEEQQPFVLVLARRGIIFMHESFGTTPEGQRLPLDHRFHPDSIGKNFAALVFAQFMEQGRLELDQTVGRFIPGWPVEGSKAITFRQLFDHTSGIEGHTWFNGLANPWLEDAFAAHVVPHLEPGRTFRFGGNGSNIAAQVMALLDGRPFPVLMREMLFRPLGAESIIQYDAGWASEATVLDMARVGQMLLQRGAYGHLQFFGDEVYNALLPGLLVDQHALLEDKEVVWGIGLEPMRHPDNSSRGFSPIGHGSASSSIYWLEPDLGLLVVAGRLGTGDAEVHRRHFEGFIRTLRSVCLP